MLPRPGADLRGVAQHFVEGVITLQHEAAQALPAATRHFARRVEFQQVHRLTVEVADAVFGKHRKLLALEPFPREQRAVGIMQKALAAAGDGPAAGGVVVQQRCGSPAWGHVSQSTNSGFCLLIWAAMATRRSLDCNIAEFQVATYSRPSLTVWSRM